MLRHEIQTLVVGCGRRYGGDDAVGQRVAEAIARARLPGLEVRVSESPGRDLLETLDGIDRLILIDAALAADGIPPGTWQRIDYHADAARLRLRRWRDTHGMGLEAALTTAEACGALPADVRVYAIAIAGSAPGDRLSPAAERAVAAVAAAIRHDILKRDPDGTDGSGRAGVPAGRPAPTGANS